MTALGSHPDVDQLLAAVVEAERARPENGHLSDDRLLGPKLERIFTEYGPATDCVAWPATGDQERLPVATGLPSSWAVRWVARPLIEHQVSCGDLDAVLDKVVPLRGVTVCDRCDAAVPPRWILLLPTGRSHVGFLVCDSCHDYVCRAFQPVRFDLYVD